jgi:hypothetical protein
MIYGMLMCFMWLLVQPLAHAQNSVSLHKGVNVFPWLYRARSVDGKDQVYLLDHSFPYAGEYTHEKLVQLKTMGFDFVRIPVEPNPFLTVDASQRGRLINQILEAYGLANEAGLTTIIDFHPREAVPHWHAATILTSGDDWKLYRSVLIEVASALIKESRGHVLLELMNEPPTGWKQSDGDLWEETQKDYVKAIRRVAPNLPLIVTGDRGGGIDGLMRLDPEKIDDQHVFYSFHYYDPMVITHQGATWTTKEYRKFLSDIQYPPAAQGEKDTLLRIQTNIFSIISDHNQANAIWSEAEPQIRQYFETRQGKVQIDADFGRVRDWATSHKIPASRILLGEFGIYRPGASEETTVNYLKDIRTAAEHDGFAWAFFNYEPKESLPAFSMLKLPGSIPADFDADITVRALGLSLPSAEGGH